MIAVLHKNSNALVGATVPVARIGSPWRFLRVNKKQLLIDVLLWCVLAAFIALGLANINELQQYPSVSLRYETPFSGKVAYGARQYSIEHSGEECFWPTFWHESKALAKGEYRSADSVCILFSGDATLVWPARYLGGTAPGVTDGYGCSVSSALAWALWGGIDVVGKTVEVNGETRAVRGVFEGEDLLAIVSIRDEDTSQSFTAVELSGEPNYPTRNDVVNFARSAGLGNPDSILIGTLTSLASVLAALPFMILALYALILCIGHLKVYPTAIRVGLLLVLIVFAVRLPWLLDMAPDWMIPTRWSDFSFWSSLITQTRDNIREYLILFPKLRDVAYKMLLLKQVALAFPAVGCALAVCFRNHGKQRRI